MVINFFNCTSFSSFSSEFVRIRHTRGFRLFLFCKTFREHREDDFYSLLFCSIILLLNCCPLAHPFSVSLTPFAFSRTHTRATYDRTKDNRGAACRVPQRARLSGCPKGVTPGSREVVAGQGGGKGTRVATGMAVGREKRPRAESRKTKRSRPAGRGLAGKG